MVRGSLWLIGSKAVALVAAFAAMVVVSRSFGPEVFGQLAFAIALVGLVAPLSEFGLNAVVVKAIARNPENFGAILGTALTMRVAATALALAIGWAAIRIMRPDDIQTQMFVTILLAAELLRAGALFSLRLEADRQFDTIALATGAVSIVFAALKIVLVTLGLGMNELIWAYAGEIAVTGPLFVLLERLRCAKTRLSVDPSCFRRLAKPAFVLAFSGVLAVANLKIDQVMVGQILGDGAAGQYAVAARLSEMWFFVPVMIAAAAMPELVSMQQRSKSKMTARMARLLDVNVGLGLVVALITTLLAPWAIDLLFGAQYAAAAPVLVLHVWGGIFVAMRTMASKWIVLHEIYGMSVVSHGAGAAINIGLNLALIPAMGLQGAALATVISYAASGYLAFHFHPGTRPLANAMTRSLLSPVRIPLKLARSLVAGNALARRER
ncbi:flippase [Aurantiacibacter hainanensis]|uniref:flippase n=1 Tax=Aurantiacibacter hainanensis TaxID=3076114 RepID=UPI0030C6A89F